MIDFARLSSRVLCVAIVLSLQACSEEEPPPEPVIRPVRYQTVVAEGGDRVRSFSGTAKAGQESRLSFKVSGTIEKLPVKVGNQVEVGTLIAALDDKDYRLQVQEAEAALASAEALARNNASNYDRVRKLYENNNASLNDLEGARAAAESAGEQVKSVEKRLELAQSQLGYAKLKAPTAGAIAAVQVEPNENVQAGQLIVLLTSGSRLEVEVAVPGVLIAQIRESDEVQVQFDALGDRSFGGRVTEVGVAATGMATTFPVTVRLNRDESDCRPGMAAEVLFRFGQGGGREHIYLPLVAVGEDRQGRFVYIVESTDKGFGMVSRRSVEVKDSSVEGKGLEVLSGLSDGELVVTAGVSRLVDGQKVRLMGAE